MRLYIFSLVLVTLANIGNLNAQSERVSSTLKMTTEQRRELIAEELALVIQAKTDLTTLKLQLSELNRINPSAKLPAVIAGGISFTTITATIVSLIGFVEAKAPLAQKRFFYAALGFGVSTICSIIAGQKIIRDYTPQQILALERKVTEASVLLAIRESQLSALLADW